MWYRAEATSLPDVSRGEFQVTLFLLMRRAFQGVYLARGIWQFILLTFIASIFSLSTSSAHAFTCSEETIGNGYFPFERAFILSDVVFSGIAKPSNSADNVRLKVLKWYKTPDKSYNTQAEIGVHSMTGRLQEGREYIVYGNLYKTKDNSYRVEVKPCLGATKAEPATIINQLREWKIDPLLLEKNTLKSDRLIFRGRVHKIQHQQVRRRTGPDKIISDIESEIGFDVQEVFKNDDIARDKQEPKRVVSRVMSCGPAYQIGQEYLVFARIKWFPSRAGSAQKRIQGYSIDCIPERILNIHEQEMLKKYSK